MEPTAPKRVKPKGRRNKPVSQQLLLKHAKTLGVELEFVSCFTRIVGDDKWKRRNSMYNYIKRRLKKNGKQPSKYSIRTIPAR